MKVAGNAVRRAWKLASALMFAACCATSGVQAQAPYLLPYSVTSVLGGGAATKQSGSCAGVNGSTAVAADAYGDGCLAVSSPSIGTDLHDVAVDQQGDVFFIDNGTYGTVRRIDGRTGIVTVFVGGSANTTLCAGAVDKYGDGCPANDANFASGTVPVGGNQNAGFSTDAGKFRGLGVDKNGDVYIADYTDHVIHKISATTGLYTQVAGYVSGTSVKVTSGVSGSTGDKGPATLAKLYAPRGVIADIYGNIIIADTSNNVIRVVYEGGAPMASLITLLNPGVTPVVGDIYTIGGVNSGNSPASVSGYGGDGGLASSASVLFATPEDVLVDANENIFIGDFGNNRVRVIYSGGSTVAHLIAAANGGTVAQVGYIYTVVGGGAGTYTSPAVVPSTSVPIGNPRKLTVDANDNLFIADSTYDVVWFVDATTGYMRVVAGQYGVSTNGTYCAAKTDAFGDGCPALQATFVTGSELAVAVDPNENVYVNDPGDARIRKLTTNQVFPATVLGASLSQTLLVHFAAGDSAAATNPFTLTGSTDFVIASSSCTTNPDTTVDCQVVVTLTPTKPGPEFAQLKIASTQGQKAAFGLSTFSLAPSLVVDPGTTASVGTGLKSPFSIAQDMAGNTYIADTGNNRVVEVAAGGATTVLAGTGTAGYSGDGASAASAKLSAPKGVAVGRNGAVYIADTGNNVIRRIDPVTGFISTYGGAGTACVLAVDTLGDGCLATAATFNAPSGVAVDLNDNVYVTDTGNNQIREITPSGYVFHVSGGASSVCSAGDTFGNGCGPLYATFNGPTGIQIDAFGDLYIADTGDQEVRKIAGNVVSLVAGTGQAGGSGNGGTATTAQLSSPTGVAVDAAGDVYIADSGNAAVRVVNGSGLISTVTGSLNTPGTGTLSGSAFALGLVTPSGVYAAGNGMLYIADTGNSRAVSVNRQTLTNTFSRTQPGSTSATLLVEETNAGSEPVTLASPLYTATGNTSSFTVMPATGSVGCTTGQVLSFVTGSTNSCNLLAAFAPATLGPLSATYTLAGSYTANSVSTPLSTVPTLQLVGVGALLTATSSKSTVTSGTPQYSVPFTVSTTVTPASCNTAAPACYPTGTVLFQINGVTVTSGTVSATGIATGTISGQSVTPANAPLSIVAVYSGDSYYAASTAPALSVAIAQGSTATMLSLSSSALYQFAPLTLTASVQSTSTTSIPTGTVSFYAGSTLIASAVPINPTTGIATTTDASNSFGVYAGTYAITAVYSGDNNFATSTSSPVTLNLKADVPGFQFNYNTNVSGTTPTCSVPTVAATGYYTTSASTGSPCQGTAQGSTAQDYLTVGPTNTLNGTMTFACTGMPANSVCTFQPTSLTFTPTPGQPTPQAVQVTLWTDIPPGTNPAQASLNRQLHLPGERTVSVATLLGWPVLLLSVAGMVGLRKRMRQTRLLAVLVLCGLFAGSSVLLTGCFNAKTTPALTPTGTYTVNVTATGPNGVTGTLATPITFTVGTGVPTQE